MVGIPTKKMGIALESWMKKCLLSHPLARVMKMMNSQTNHTPTNGRSMTDRHSEVTTPKPTNSYKYHVDYLLSYYCSCIYNYTIFIIVILEF